MSPMSPMSLMALMPAGISRRQRGESDPALAVLALPEPRRERLHAFVEPGMRHEVET